MQLNEANRGETPKSENKSGQGFDKFARNSFPSLQCVVNSIYLKWGKSFNKRSPKLFTKIRDLYSSDNSNSVPETVRIGVSKRYCVQSFENLDTQAFRMQQLKLIGDRKATQLRGYLAIANQLLYWWAKCLKVAKKIPGQGHIFSRDRAIAALNFDIRMVCAVSSTAAYAEKLWTPTGENGGSGVSLRSIHTRLDELRALGLLDWEDREFSDRTGKKGRVKQPRIYTYIDVVGLLFLAEACEERLYQLTARDHDCAKYPNGNIGLSFLPEHFGNFTRLLFNTIIPGWGWRREGPSDENEPVSHEESDLAREDIAKDWRGSNDWWVHLRKEQQARNLRVLYEGMRHRYFDLRGALGGQCQIVKEALNCLVEKRSMYYQVLTET